MANDTTNPRERLIRAADDLFYQGGINATGIDRLIEAAGVAKMTLYNNYKSKDELVAAWLGWRHEDWERRLNEKLAAADEPVDRILAVFDTYLDSAREPRHRGCVFVNAAAEIPSSTHPAHGVVRAHKASVRDFLAEEAESLGVGDSMELAEQLFVLLEGGVVTAGVRGDAGPLVAARNAAETILAAAQTA